MRTSIFRLCTFSLLACTAATADAQIRRSVKILESPEANNYSIADPDFTLENGYTGEKRWTVFAAYDGSPTFARPAGISRLQTLQFMQPCYVIGQKGEYLKLAKYKAGLTSRRFAPGHIANWKEVEYLGWIHHSQMLPYRVALKDRDDKTFLKYITALRGREVLETPQAFFANDSLKVFGRPDLMSPTRARLPINTVLYAYKLSADRKFYLVGNNPQCSPEGAGKVVLGWMPVQTVQPWGYKAFVEVTEDTRIIAAEGVAVPAMNMLTKSAVVPRSKTESNGYGMAYTPSGAADGADDNGWVSVSLADTVLNLYPQPAQSLLPVYAQQRTAQNQPPLVRTAALSNILDARDNRVYNILGTPVTYDRYQDFKRSAGRLNVVFLVDGAQGGDDASSPVLTVLQQLQQRLDTTTQFSSVRYAGVIQREDANGAPCLAKNTLSLRRSYTELSDFFERGLAESRMCDGYGSNVYGGIPSAAGLLAGHEGESNIVIVIGSAVSTSSNAYNWSALVNSLTAANARLLVYQTQSDASTAYNDYVIDAKKLIVQSADNISEIRKEILVEAPKAAAVADFRLATGEQNTFVLDYPAASRWQGGVVFPAKLGAMPLLSLASTLDTMLRQVSTDNRETVAALDRVFDSYAGNIGTRVDARMEPVFGTYTASLPDATLRHFRKSLDVFRFAAVMPMEDTATFRRGLLLSKDEFDQYTDFLAAAALVLDAPAFDRRPAGRKMKRMTRGYVIATGMKKPMPYRRMTVADAFALPSGMPVTTPVLRTVRVKKLGKVDDAQYTAVQKAVIDFQTELKARQAAGSIRYLPVAPGAAPVLWVADPL